MVILYVMARMNFYPLFPFLADFTGGREQNFVYFLRFSCDFRKKNGIRDLHIMLLRTYVFRVNRRQVVATFITGVPWNRLTAGAWNIFPRSVQAHSLPQGATRWATKVNQRKVIYCHLTWLNRASWQHCATSEPRAVLLTLFGTLRHEH